MQADILRIVMSYYDSYTSETQTDMEEMQQQTRISHTSTGIGELTMQTGLRIAAINFVQQTQPSGGDSEIYVSDLDRALSTAHTCRSKT